MYELPLLTALCDTLALLASEAPVECRVILGFCRRGGALCPPEQAEAIIMQQFEHTVRATGVPWRVLVAAALRVPWWLDSC